MRRMIVLEALLPALAGAALGLALAFPVVAAFVAGAGDLLPRTIGVGVTLPAVAVTLLAAIGVGALAGAVSLGRLRTAGIAERLRSGAGAVGGGRSSARLRNGLVAAQVALAVVLVFDAGLLVRSFQRLANVPLGLHEEGVLGAAISLDGSAYADFEEGSAFLRAFVDEVAVLPGVEAAALSNHAPLREGRIFYPFVAEDVPETLELPHPQLTRVVTEGYFAATGIDVVAGRPLDRDDVLLDRPVVVVSRALADAWWPGSAALGRRLSYGFDQEAGEPSWLEVVGVADDVRDRTITGAAPGMVYAPFQSRHLGGDRWRELYVTVRSSAAGGLAAPLRSLLAERDRSVPLYDVRTIDRVLADVTRRDRTVTLLLAAAGALALLLATVGLYGSLAFAVGQRRREIGLRLALGAEPNGVRGLVIRQSGALVGAGLVVGAALVYATRNVVAGALFETNPDDPGAIAMALALLAAVGFAATWGPAHQASSVPPTITLKEN